MRWLARFFGKSTRTAGKLEPPDITPPPLLNEREPKYIFKTTLAGVAHAPGAEAEISRLRTGEAVLLVRDSRNPVDPKTISVFSRAMRRIGYVPAHTADKLADDIDAGELSLDATVHETQPPGGENPHWNALIEIKMFYSDPSNLDG